jgi:hypothetical protein
MTNKKEEAIIDSVKSFEEMADLVLIQLTLLEKYMSLNDKDEMKNVLSRIEENENKIDEFEVIISDKFIQLYFFSRLRLISENLTQYTVFQLILNA